jgi:hypothetical protein
MTLRRSLVVALSLSALFAFAPGTATAQSASDAERAGKLFTEASALAAASKYDEACPKFEESQRLDGGLGTQFNLALCFEKLGKLGSAWRNYRDVARLGRQTGKTGREEAARQKMEQLRRRVSRLLLASRDPDVTLKVDGQAVDRDSWSFYAVDAGEHLIEASAPAKTTWKQRVTVAGVGPNGEGVEHAIAIPALETAAGQTRVVTVTKDSSNPKRTLGFVLGGVGVVGLGAGLVTGIALLNDRSIADDRCQPRCTDASARDAVATGKTLLPINVVAWAVGIAGVGVGSFLIFTSGGEKDKATSTSASVAPLLGPDGGGASVMGRF